MSKRVLKITGYVVSFLLITILVLKLCLLLPNPWSKIFFFAAFIFFFYVAIFFLDMTLPFFNLLNPIPTRLPVEKNNMVALTFDDGPSEFTLQILDILDRFNVKGTFFCIGENIVKHPEILSRLSQDGHTVANHSYSHQIFPFLSKEEIHEEISKTSAIIEKNSKKKERFFRFPKGYQSRKGANVARELGLKPIGFSYPIFDVENPPAQELIDRVLSKVQSGDILLMHDGYPSFKQGSRSSLVEALPAIIEGIQKKNLAIVSLEEIF